jgi:hypothetical protein
LKSNPALLADGLVSKPAPETIISPISACGEVADAARPPA